MAPWLTLTPGRSAKVPLMLRSTTTLAVGLATLIGGASTVACGLLTGVDWDRVAVSGDAGGSQSSGASGTVGTSGTNGSSGSSAGIDSGAQDGGPCVVGTVVQNKVCLRDGTLAPKCESAACGGGFAVCMNDPKNPDFNRCVPPPGTFVTSCSAAVNVTNRTTPEPGGPVIWGGQLIRAADCSPGRQRGYNLTFSYFDAESDAPDKDFAGIALESDFGFNNPPMSLLSSTLAFQGNKSSGTVFMFPCVNAVPLPTSIAIVLVDTAGHKSNPLCLTIAP